MNMITYLALPTAAAHQGLRGISWIENGIESLPAHLPQMAEDCQGTMKTHCIRNDLKLKKSCMAY